VLFSSVLYVGYEAYYSTTNHIATLALNSTRTNDRRKCYI